MTLNLPRVYVSYVEKFLSEMEPLIMRPRNLIGLE